MRKIGLGILIAIVAAVLTVGVASALPRLPGKLPDVAQKRSPVINEERDVVAPPTLPPFPQLPENELTKIVFIRYAPGFPKIKPARPACGDGELHPSEDCEAPDYSCPAGSVCINCKCVVGDEEEPTTACYDFLAGSKPRWNWIEDYYYGDSTLESPSASAVFTWEGATSGDIFGAGVSGIYPWGVYDYTNSISFGDYPETGVLAVTAIWFRGKNIYEYDIMFDTDYSWGDATVDSTVFDLGTVTLHEFGHGAGLNDLYDVACIDNVMYGFLGKGEVKTTLGSGDITGIQELYGGL